MLPYMQHGDGELELLGFSFVPVPANPYALSMRRMKEMKLNMPQLVMKAGAGFRSLFFRHF
jgi:hypothetical protein